ncbi:MAG: HAMP domain-containing histidine kinase [Candidatus Sungiibacteriota bacterium]|uniref:histidine kinase n=1 Tax=Candidatus Sungiibacteriota bacterium TaxID=2750080 RepID=A0A7T5RK72_9BACT|nr:MAG: HAMP domain-containing histidine kinase [Candidatus Sungbacteria bacterium]
MVGFLQHFNVVAECRASKLPLWQCPPFLFLIMGVITIVSMVATFIIASRYTEEPEVAALIVIFVTALFLVMGNLIIAGFNKVSEANRMKSEFISIVSHQLRSPLSIFKWTLDVIDRESKNGKNHDDLANFMATLRDTTENMIRLVNSLLEVSRIEARTVVLKKERFSLAELTQKVIENFRRYAEASGIFIRFEPETLLPEVVADRERIAMVLQNFIDNAIRYTRGSGHILITINKEDNNLRWAVKDEGMGIPPDQQKYIFQKFFRSSQNQHTRGSGVGLYIAKAVIGASEGKIGFTSKESEGSTFWFTLPIT